MAGTSSWQRSPLDQDTGHRGALRLGICSRPVPRSDWLKFAIVAAASVGTFWLRAPHTDASGVDLHTYQNAHVALASKGNPYALNPEQRAFEDHYRYPPLLALLVPPAVVWYPLLVFASALPFWLGWRQSGLIGIMIPLLLLGCTIENLGHGNAQALVVAALCLVPVTRRGGAIAVAYASWLKLYPALVIFWYLGRRDWEALRWFGGAWLILGLMQLPWLGDFIAYATSSQDAIPAEASLRDLGLGVWIGVCVALALLTIRQADHQLGWILALLLQIASLPRVNINSLTNLIPACITPEPVVPLEVTDEPESQAPEGDRQQY
jgi:hypothetical protein